MSQPQPTPLMPAPADTPRHIVAPPNCTGCGLCANVCPKDAIIMGWNEDGFPSPSVNTSLCIECGLCSKACIAQEAPQPHEDEIDKVRSYAAWHRVEEFHQMSSSGGVFSALAQEIFARGGCVFGVVWQNKETAVFSKAENMEELAPMRGSKYTPALPGTVYREVKQELKSRPVLFTGTPCQVHALRAYLHRDHENLFTQEIVCHGVPSHHALHKYIQEDEAASGKTIDHVLFRDKTESWLHYSVTRFYTDGTQARRDMRQDPYMRMFLSDGALNASCYSCPYAHLPRQGDICLGDYWGVEKLHPEWPIKQGIAVVIANTAKGQELLDKAGAHLTLKEEPFENIYRGQPVIYVKPQAPLNPHRPYALAALRSETAPLQQAIDEAREHDYIFGRRVCRKKLSVRLMLKIRKKLRKLHLIR